MLVATAIRNSCAHVVESRYHETGVRLWAWGLLVQGAGDVWECGCGWFSKYFSFRKVCQ